MTQTTMQRLDAYKALFDPYYIPALLVGRKKESAFLKGFLYDNLATNHGTESADVHGTAIMLNGLHGIGKSTLVHKVMADLCQDPGRPTSLRLSNVTINCLEKDEAQLLGDLAAKLEIDIGTHGISSGELTSPNVACCAGETGGSSAVHPVSIVGNTGNISTTWSTISACLRKQARQIAYNIFFNNVESVPLKFFNKLACNLKHQGLNLLMATSMRHNNYFIENLDMSIDLDVYKMADLHEIVDQRARVAFPGIDSSVGHFITDAVVGFDSPRPGPCINIMKHLYPHVKALDADAITLEMLQESVKNALPEISYNELDLAEFFGNAPIQNIIFLDNIVGKLETSAQLYITRPELQDIFNGSCESLDMEPMPGEFDTMMADMMASNIFLKSNHQQGSYFTMIPARLIKGYVDATIS
jgi:hypothetical protein